MYAVVESGGKQYRVEQGSVLVVDRLKAEVGDKVALKPVLFKDKEIVVDAKGLEKIKIEATVTEHLRGDKIKVFKYKPKKGYSRRAGHRAELTKLEVTSLGGGAKKAAPKKAAAGKAGIQPPPEQEVSSQVQGKVAPLNNSGQFDQDYVQAQLQAHQDAVALFTAYSRNGDNPALKSFAAKTLPTLKHHLTQVEALSRQAGKSSSAD